MGSYGMGNPTAPEDPVVDQRSRIEEVVSRYVDRLKDLEKFEVDVKWFVRMGLCRDMGEGPSRTTELQDLMGTRGDALMDVETQGAELMAA